MEPLLCRASPLRLAASSLPLPFLAPSLFVTRNPPHHAQFSTSAPNLFRKKRHGNKQRGVSGVRRTGLRYPVGMSKFPLPEPQLDPEKRTKITTDENHGLWGFFNKEKKLLTEPMEEAKHGRSWRSRELRNKSWEDIHALWWLCCKERNRLATETAERARVKAGGGDAEARGRDREVRQTMAAIKMALTERWYAWEDARKLAAKDRTVNLNSDMTQPAYERSGIFQDEDPDPAPNSTDENWVDVSKPPPGWKPPVTK